MNTRKISPPKASYGKKVDKKNNKRLFNKSGVKVNQNVTRVRRNVSRGR